MARLLRGALLAACLVCAAVPGAAQSGTGHFRYGALSWERNGVDSREVTFTLSSSWRRSYEGFAVPVTDTSLPVTLSGYVTPKLTVGEGSTEHINLPLRIEQFDKSGSTYEQGGDWITGYTIIRHTYSSDGPFAVTFAGCCVAGSYDKEHFSITAMVALSTSDFSPALAIIPVVNAEPGHSFAVPAIHPQGLIGPMLRDGSMAFFNFALPAGQPAGISMDAATGVVSVGASVAVGQHLLAVQVGLNHSMAKSGAQFLVNVRAPGGTTAYLSPAVPSEDDSRGSGGDVVYSVRTGFAISVFIDIISPTAGATYQVSTAGTNLTLFGMRADVVYGAPGRAAAAFQLRWDKPCVGDAMHVAICFSAMQFVGGAPTGDRTAPGCIEVFILEDEAPVFLAPMQGDVQP
ncbi:hypothetical protein T484DRAFT_1789969 [Baffinella frigidus]|nr:hypothetical protein T484DRAFT_1789969 [Cryptophyta sp. CCMP2293]